MLTPGGKGSFLRSSDFIIVNVKRKPIRKSNSETLFAGWMKEMAINEGVKVKLNAFHAIDRGRYGVVGNREGRIY